MPYRLSLLRRNYRTSGHTTGSESAHVSRGWLAGYGVTRPGDLALPHTSLALQQPWQWQSASPCASACIMSAGQSTSFWAEPSVQRRSRPPALGRLAPQSYMAKGMGAESEELGPVLPCVSIQHVRLGIFNGNSWFHFLPATYIVIRDYLLVKNRNPLELACRLL